MGEPEKVRQAVEEGVHLDRGTFIYEGPLLKSDKHYFTREQCERESFKAIKKRRLKDLHNILRKRTKNDNAEMRECRKEYEEWLEDM